MPRVGRGDLRDPPGQGAAGADLGRAAGSALPPLGVGESLELPGLGPGDGDRLEDRYGDGRVGAELRVELVVVVRTGTGHPRDLAPRAPGVIEGVSRRAAAEGRDLDVGQDPAQVPPFAAVVGLELAEAVAAAGVGGVPGEIEPVAASRGIGHRPDLDVGPGLGVAHPHEVSIVVLEAVEAPAAVDTVTAEVGTQAGSVGAWGLDEDGVGPVGEFHPLPVGGVAGIVDHPDEAAVLALESPVAGHQLALRAAGVHIQPGEVLLAVPVGGLVGPALALKGIQARRRDRCVELSEVNLPTQASIAAEVGHGEVDRLEVRAGRTLELDDVPTVAVVDRLDPVVDQGTDGVSLTQRDGHDEVSGRRIDGIEVADLERVVVYETAGRREGCKGQVVGPRRRFRQLAQCAIRVEEDGSEKEEQNAPAAVTGERLPPLLPNPGCRAHYILRRS